MDATNRAIALVRWSAMVAATSVALNCGSHATGPQPLDLAGAWTGAESDRLGTAYVSWNVTQSGTSISGTAEIRPVDVNDGSCASCHKNKVGAVAGTITGDSVRLSLYFPAGGMDQTPACSIDLQFTAFNATASAISGTYQGSDPCEGIFDGALTMARRD